MATSMTIAELISELKQVLVDAESSSDPIAQEVTANTPVRLWVKGDWHDIDSLILVDDTDTDTLDRVPGSTRAYLYNGD